MSTNSCNHNGIISLSRLRLKKSHNNRSKKMIGPIRFGRPFNEIVCRRGYHPSFPGSPWGNGKNGKTSVPTGPIGNNAPFQDMSEHLIPDSISLNGQASIPEFYAPLKNTNKSGTFVSEVAEAELVPGLCPFPEELQCKYSSPNDFIKPGTSSPFSESITTILRAPVNENDIEIKPDGILYLPEIKYRQILLDAFGPGGWSLLPVGPHSFISQCILTREYMLLCQGQYVSMARGSMTLRNFGGKFFIFILL